MKTLLLVRHAKSSWENFSVKDEERPLSERGKKSAPEMAARLLKKKIPINALLSSPAKRARTTAEYFIETYGLNKNGIIIVPDLYMPNNEAFIRVIRNAPPGAASIALFSHNNRITDFANTLSETRIDHMPTCAVFAVKCNIKNWSEFEVGDNEYYFFDYPKKV
jgi:phosphohistidine phosphatase